MDRKRLRGAPLSLQQGRLWEFMQDNQVYRVQGSIVIKGNLDNQAFQLALQSLVKRQEILQTVFYCLPGMDTPLQIIGQPQQVYCPIISLEACSTSEQDNLLDDYFSVLQMQSFDLKRGPLLQTTLICLSNDIHVLLVAISALCADAPTLSLLVMQLAKIYENFFQVEKLQDGCLDPPSFCSLQHL